MRTLLLFLSMVTVSSVAGCGESHGDPGTYGDACGEGCAEGLSCVRAEGFVDGYCTSICEDGICPAEAVCATDVATPLCLARCVSAADCRDGYQCWRGACRPLCSADGDCGGSGATCGAGGQCDGAECAGDADCGPMQRCAGFRCVPLTDAGATLPPGAECLSDDECLDGVCLPPALGGFCTIPCADADDCFELPVVVETGCTALDDGGGVSTVCAAFPAGSRSMGAACTIDDGCEARLCQQGQCTEVCDDDGDCLVGQICRDLPLAAGGTYSGCGYADRAGAVTIEEHALGEMDLRAGFLGQLELATPPDAVSVTLQAQRVSGDPLALSFVTVTDPADEPIFDVQQILALTDQPIRWLPIDTGEMISMLVPNTTPDRVTYLGGRYAWDVSPFQRTMGDTGSARLRMSALVKRAEGGVVSRGTFDLNVHFVSGVGPGASGAPGSSKMQNTLSRLDTILSAAGIDVGTVRYFDVADTGYRVISTTDGSDSELSQLFRESAARSGRAVNVFFVSSIEGPSGGFAALGVAGGIPGPVGIHGTEHSGVAVVWDGNGAAVLGHVLAHELGHYVGLFHSTENARPCGPGEDPTTDDCAPFGGGDQLVDTSRGDTSNLMYWSIVGGGTNDAMSAGQGFVYRASAAVGP